MRCNIDLNQTQVPGICQTLKSYMGNVVFKCPRTGLNVQHWLAEEVEPETENAPRTCETVVCKACTRIHFINRLTGKLLGES